MTYSRGGEMSIDRLGYKKMVASTSQLSGRPGSMLYESNGEEWDRGPENQIPPAPIGVNMEASPFQVEC